MIRLVGIVIMVASLSRFVAPLLGADIEGIDAIPAWAAYTGSLVGGFLSGYGNPGASFEKPGAGGLEEEACPSCGAVVQGEQRFCTACGSALETGVAAEAEDTALRCPNNDCGEIVQLEQNFCTACGTSLK